MQRWMLLFVTAIAAAQAPDTKHDQSPMCPSGVPLEVAPSSRYWFDGSLGQNRVRMYLERGGEAVVGVFYDTKNWLPVTVGGRWGKGDVLELTARMNGAPFGQLDGKMAGGQFSGSWRPQGTLAIKAGSARLKTISQPICNQFAGALRQFNDPRWPVTFNYPDSWHVDAQVDAITLTCPDPSAMAYSDFDIKITRGVLAGEGVQAGGFVRCGQAWRYGPACHCDNLTACTVAEIQHHEGIEIVAGEEREWRVYCREGGYVAQGFGDERLLLMDDDWLDLSGQGPSSEWIEPIVKTIRRRR